MPHFAFPEISPAIPEMVLAGLAMVLLLFGAFRGERSTRLITWLAVAGLVAVFILGLGEGGPPHFGFYGMFVSDTFARFMNSLVLIGSAITILIGLHYDEDERIARFEFPVLVMLSTTGMMVMISANDLIILYVGLELQNLALYIAAGFNRDSARSSEAGLKYFVLGALSSGILLYGLSLVYGFADTTAFADLARLFAGPAPVSPGVIVGLAFIIAGFAFKVSAVPFHMWVPDVYEGAPTPVAAFFAVAPKLAAFALFVRVLIEPFGPLAGEWRQIIFFLSVASMIFGAVAAIAQHNIKRLMAYSSIGHVGYALIGLTAGTAAGIRGVLIYLAMYLVMTLGAWTVILCMRRQGRMLEEISDLSGLSQTHPGLALALAIFMFALTGLPPTAGFFAKLYIFLAAIDAKLIGLAIFGVVTSVVGAFYYFRIVKVMYFDEPAGAFDQPFTFELQSVLIVTAIITLFFFLLPGPVTGGAEAAAASLFVR
ncbi:MAG: NADH-quinone oxidoreductase subunit NuoN [Alphaproteobacteria bacterium]|nr:NADH-quinone oxidoreductase subunit NuoN [Alphaproteobacteria bacterium]